MMHYSRIHGGHTAVRVAGESRWHRRFFTSVAVHACRVQEVRLLTELHRRFSA